MGWQWHQLDHMQIICTSLQTDNHASTSPLTNSSSIINTAERVLTMSQLQYLSYVTPRVRWYSSNGGSIRITSNLDSRSRRSNVSRSHFKYLQTPTYHNRCTTLFPGPTRWAGATRELLDFMVQGKINRGRHTDHLDGRHSIRTNQCPLPPSPHFLQAGCPCCRPTNSVKALKANTSIQIYTVFIAILFSMCTCYVWYGDSAGNTIHDNSSIFSLVWMHLLVAVSKGTLAVKLCSNKILQFLFGGAG